MCSADGNGLKNAQHRAEWQQSSIAIESLCRQKARTGIWDDDAKLGATFVFGENLALFRNHTPEGYPSNQQSKNWGISPNLSCEQPDCRLTS
jgi:hypothetical protein